MVKFPKLDKKEILAELKAFLIGSEFNYNPSEPDATKEAFIAFVRAVFGEVLVTFLFITCVVATGCNLARANLSDPAAQGLATALVGVGLIYSFADVSGAHFNPAVTFGVLCRRKMSVIKCLFFIAAQLLGASCAIMLLKSIPAFASMDYMVRRGSVSTSLFHPFLLFLSLCLISLFDSRFRRFFSPPLN